MTTEANIFIDGIEDVFCIFSDGYPETVIPELKKALEDAKKIKRALDKGVCKWELI